MDENFQNNGGEQQYNANVGTQQPNTMATPENTKFCKHCGGKIAYDAVMCVLCGRQVEQLQPAPQSIVINNSNANNNINTNTNTNGQNGGRAKNKWVALLLCIFLGGLGGHKFYEGKYLMAVVYIFTYGLFGIGIIVDIIRIALKPNPYYI